ncbi:hypothetical protein [Shewanella maritima]|uniref:hypothetical protein n=1 Tax=Shewanella maritima TaxID=2520507 RepID=UPI0037368F88
MELKKCTRCYTNVCVNGRWFHHDHLTDTAFMLNGSDPINVKLPDVPTTENELVDMLHEHT